MGKIERVFDEGMTQNMTQGIMQVVTQGVMQEVTEVFESGRLQEDLRSVMYQNEIGCGLVSEQVGWTC